MRRCSRTAMTLHPIILQAFQLLLLCTFVVLVNAEAVSERHKDRDFQVLSDDTLRQIVSLDPPEWTDVTSGHLGKLLIPRVCK